MELFLTNNDLCRQLGINRAKAKLLRDCGLLKGIRVGKGYRYYIKDIERFVSIAKSNDLSSIDRIIAVGQAERIEDERKKTKTRDQKRYQSDRSG